MDPVIGSELRVKSSRKMGTRLQHYGFIAVGCQHRNICPYLQDTWGTNKHPEKCWIGERKIFTDRAELDELPG